MELKCEKTCKYTSIMSQERVVYELHSNSHGYYEVSMRPTCHALADATSLCAPGLKGYKSAVVSMIWALTLLCFPTSYNLYNFSIAW